MNKAINKRDFIKYGLAGLGFFYCRNMFAHTKYLENMSNKLNMLNDKPWKWSKEVFYYEKRGENMVCGVCPHNCVIAPNLGGFCRNKVNYQGKLFSLAYGNPCSVNIDPIEKKPLLHFKPQSRTFSLASAGCNFRCLNCQNWSISQYSPVETRNHELMPEQVIAYCKKNNCQSVSYTYSEPVVFYEYMFDIAVLAKKNNLDNVVVTNGYINEKPLRELLPYIDAVNIDLKTFDEKKHFDLTKGFLEPVLNTLKVLKEEHVWTEITNLVIPQWSDDMETIKKMCEWLVENDLSHFPLHFSRFTPMHKLTHLPITPVSVLERAHKIAKDAGIKYAYVGNVPGHQGENTLCSKCHKVLIERRGYVILNNHIVNGKCKFCDETIHGVW